MSGDESTSLVETLINAREEEFEKGQRNRKRLGERERKKWFCKRIFCFFFALSPFATLSSLIESSPGKIVTFSFPQTCASYSPSFSPLLLFSPLSFCPLLSTFHPPSPLNSSFMPPDTFYPLLELHFNLRCFRSICLQLFGLSHSLTSFTFLFLFLIIIKFGLHLVSNG